MFAGAKPRTKRYLTRRHDMTTVKELVKMANQAYRANPGADVDTP